MKHKSKKAFKVLTLLLEIIYFIKNSPNEAWSQATEANQF